MSNTAQVTGTAHGKTLEPKLRKVESRLESLTLNQDIYNFIHRPGWTTLAEVFFVNQMLEQIERTQDLLEQQLNDLARGAGMIE